MLKFFRKYNKLLLVVIGVFIMIAFLVPQAIQQLGSGGMSSKVMSVNGRRVSIADVQRVNNEVEAVSRMSGEVYPRRLGIDPRGDHFLLAREAASEGGFLGGPSDGVGFLPEIARPFVNTQYQQELGPNWARRLAMEGRMGEYEARLADVVRQLEARAGLGSGAAGARGSGIEETLATLRGIQRMRIAHATAPRLSGPRLVAEARKRYAAAEAQVLFVGVDNALSGALPEPTAEELAAHFEQYRDVEPGAGEMGFGYRRQDAFQVEWLQLDRSALASLVRIDPVEVQKRLLAAEVPPEQANTKRQEIELLLRGEQTDRLMNEASQAAKALLVTATTRLPENGPYRVLPADWESQRPRMGDVASKIVERVRESTGLTIPTPTVGSSQGRFMTVDDLQQLPGIGQAGLMRGINRVPFALIPTSAKELLTPDSAPPTVIVQAGVPVAEPAEDRARNRFYFTVTAVRRAGPPEGVEAVREQVVADVKRAKAFAALRDRADEFRARAAASSLEALEAALKTELAFTPPAPPVVEGQPTPPAPPTQVDVTLTSGVTVNAQDGISPGGQRFDDPAFIEAVVSKAREASEAGRIDVAGRLVVVPVARGRGLAVAVVTGYRDVSAEVFRAIARRLGEEVPAAQVIATNDDPLSIDRLEKRLNVVRVGVERPGEADADGGAGATPVGTGTGSAPGAPAGASTRGP